MTTYRPVVPILIHRRPPVPINRFLFRLFPATRTPHREVEVFGVPRVRASFWWRFVNWKGSHRVLLSGRGVGGFRAGHLTGHFLRPFGRVVGDLSVDRPLFVKERHTGFPALVPQRTSRFPVAILCSAR